MSELPLEWAELSDESKAKLNVSKHLFFKSLNKHLFSNSFELNNCILFHEIYHCV